MGNGTHTSTRRSRAPAIRDRARREDLHEASEASLGRSALRGGNDRRLDRAVFLRSGMPPKKKPAASKAVDPEKLTVPKLKAELKKLGLEQDGLKAVLVARLKEALGGGGEAPGDEPEPEAPAEPATKSKFPAKTAKSPPAKPVARGKRGAAAIEPEPAPTPMETDEPPVESPKAKSAKGKAAKETKADEKKPDPPSPTKAPPTKKARKAEVAALEPKKAAATIAPVPTPMDKTKPKTSGLTLATIESDSITKIAAKHWSGKMNSKFDESVVQKIYTDELGGGTQTQNLQRTQILEISQYLEKYLWVHFEVETSSKTHVMSIVAMVNEKFRQSVDAWVGFFCEEGEGQTEKFKGFFTRVMTLYSDETSLSTVEKTSRILFLTNAFASLENENVRGCVLPLVSLPLWCGLSAGRLQMELSRNSNLEKHWRHLQKKQGKAAKKALEAGKPAPIALAETVEATWLTDLVRDFLQTCENAVDSNGKVDSNAVRNCERFLELLIDVLSQLPTRRFVKTVLDETQVLVKAKMMPLFTHSSGKLFSQLTDLFSFYLSFEIDDHTGVALSDEEFESKHYDRLLVLQRLCFKHIAKLKQLALLHCGAIEKRDVLETHLQKLNELELKKLAVEQLRLVNEKDPWLDNSEKSQKFLTEVMVRHFEKRISQKKQVNAMPLYPNEDVLWDENVVPSVRYNGDKCLALPKLNLQFLTLHDYLLRNFNLFRLEATYEIREDIADVLKRMQPRRNANINTTSFSGWSRMAIPIAQNTLQITQVKQPRVGETKPSSVRCEVRVNLSTLKGTARTEWDEVKQHDVVFLLRCEGGEGSSDSNSINVAERFGLRRVRGAEVVEVRDSEGNRYNDFSGGNFGGNNAPTDGPAGYERTFVLQLDAAQYQLDVDRGNDALYPNLNVLMRRRPKENNFKSILECIRDLMNADNVIPEWLHDVFLGYGDPAAAQGVNLPREEQTMPTSIDFKDTFLDSEHLVEAFPCCDVKWTSVKSSGEKPVPPFRVTFPDTNDETNDGSNNKSLLVESYVPPDPGPYPEDQPRLNHVRFTPTQVAAVRSGVQPGLTMVVGPPGTGKTDVATQIMHCLYHNEPGQRTLLITHSNAALNDLFQKLMERDVPARYLLRLGQGERDLNTDLDFSRQGRVNAMLSRRLELLAVVERLAVSLNVPEDVAYTCETAGYFWLLHVLARWEKFELGVSQKRREGELDKHATFISDRFPFTKFFADVPNLFTSTNFEVDSKKANGCMRHIKGIFTELEECRAFELLKSPGDRSNYLLTKQAKVIAMTCTHAALKRKDFLRLGLKYDNLVMEESAQVLEIETFIPMMLQQPVDGLSRLKRIVLIGDHHQLPPVVKNAAFQKYCNLDQSLFTRFVRLGNPVIELNAQGRARPELAKLYSWRYKELGDLPNTYQKGTKYAYANPGFSHAAQFVDVQEYQGVGESSPSAHFYQNLGEAEYVVSVFQYMRLLGYPADNISILTTYRGQKHLIRDVINRRCSNHPLFGDPKNISTVDKFQGQQNDYVLLSLVKTKNVGHVRDVRRLVVAMSRARLGLYVFGRNELFQQCYELQPSLKHLFDLPERLSLVPSETFSETKRKNNETVQTPYNVPDPLAMGTVVNQLFMKWQQTQGHGQAQVVTASGLNPTQASTGGDQKRDEDEGAPEY